jgi:hypothetical protein
MPYALFNNTKRGGAECEGEHRGDECVEEGKDNVKLA